MSVWTDTLPTLNALHAPTAAELKEILDALAALTDPWTTYTPSWTASSVNPSIGNGTISGKYLQAGKFVVAAVDITMGSTTTYGTGSWQVSLPVATADALGAGAAILYDGSTAANRKPGACYRSASSQVQFLGDTGIVDATNPFTWATGDVLRFTFTFEAA